MEHANPEEELKKNNAALLLTHPSLLHQYAIKLGLRCASVVILLARSHRCFKQPGASPLEAVAGAERHSAAWHHLCSRNSKLAPDQPLRFFRRRKLQGHRAPLSRCRPHSILWYYRSVTNLRTSTGSMLLGTKSFSDDRACLCRSVSYVPRWQKGSRTFKKSSIRAWWAINRIYLKLLEKRLR